MPATAAGLARSRRRFYLQITGVVIAIAFALMLSGLALYAVKQEQEAVDERVRRVSYDYCVEIEILKQARRDDALESYARLDETLMLLGLERTPQIEERAREDRNRVLERFAARPCPRPTELPRPDYSGPDRGAP